MEKLDYAILFATKAHDGQRRKTDNVEMIFHPFTVAMLLRNREMDKNCIIAGLLHDVVEDTKFSIEDIKNIFGNKVANIVDEVTENKALPWEERKKEAIKKIETASFEGKMVECADKINNLETLYDLYLEKGEEIWDSFNKPKDKQEWYYKNMYEAVIKNSEYNDFYQRYNSIIKKIWN